MRFRFAVVVDRGRVADVLPSEGDNLSVLVIVLSPQKPVNVESPAADLWNY
ncbi:MAG: hypothetical protein R3C19_12000 [Planctomycetaceae bacterium]